MMPELYSQATLQKAKLALLLWKKAENYIEFSDFDDPDFQAQLKLVLWPLTLPNKNLVLLDINGDKSQLIETGNKYAVNTAFVLYDIEERLIKEQFILEMTADASLKLDLPDISREVRAAIVCKDAGPYVYFALKKEAKNDILKVYKLTKRTLALELIFDRKLSEFRVQNPVLEVFNDMLLLIIPNELTWIYDSNQPLSDSKQLPVLRLVVGKFK